MIQPSLLFRYFFSGLNRTKTKCQLDLNQLIKPNPESIQSQVQLSWIIWVKGFDSKQFNDLKCIEIVIKSFCIKFISALNKHWQFIDEWPNQYYEIHCNFQITPWSWDFYPFNKAVIVTSRIMRSLMTWRLIAANSQGFAYYENGIISPWPRLLLNLTPFHCIFSMRPSHM